MNNIFFTSDTHFYHANVIKYSNRPYGSVEEMNAAIIQNWNSVVRPGDRIYHLGDFGFARPEQLTRILEQLNGQKYFIVGNHDKSMWDASVKKHFIKYADMMELSVGKQKLVLCHYPLASWNRAHHGSFMLHGHSHGSYVAPDYRIWDVGVDVNNMTPISYDEIERKLNKIPAKDARNRNENR